MKTIVVMDTRERSGKKDHILSVFERNSIPVIRHGLYVGDWTLLNDMSVCIDTKTGGMQEVYGNLIQDHARFRNECKRAADAEIRLVVLVEEPGMKLLEDVKDWVNPRTVQWNRKQAAGEQTTTVPPVSSQRLYNIMRTMADSYGVIWEFCNKSETGQRIMELLGVQPDA